jgi:hypothetical protein
MEGARLLDMPIIPTIEMIPSSEKRVRQLFHCSTVPRSLLNWTDLGFSTSVCQFPYGR